MSQEREHFASRLGFIFMAAGCAIGLGNIWRFPYVAGKNGGGLFVLLYFGCLLLFGIPVLLMELALGRAGQSTYPGAFAKLQNQQSRFKWKIPAYILFSGNLILLMFYTVITGWLLIYGFNFFICNPAVYSGGFFDGMMASPGLQSIAMLAGVALTLLLCIGGVRGSVEKSMKVMMMGLLLLLGVLAFAGIIFAMWWVLNLKLSPMEKLTNALEASVKELNKQISELSQKMWSKDALQNEIKLQIQEQLKEHVQNCPFKDRCK